MTIRNMNSFISSLWDWSILDGCFGNTKIGVSDIDGVVERNGHTLFLETKRPNVPIPLGQHVMFDTWRKTGFATVIVIFGQADNPQHMQIYAKDRIHPKRPANTETVRQAVASWFEYADSQPKHYA